MRHGRRPLARNQRTAFRVPALNAVRADGAQLWVDGDCELAGTANWTGYNAPALSKVASPRTNSRGTQSLRVAHVAASPYGVIRGNLVQGRTYALSFWYRVSAGGLVLDDSTGSFSALLPSTVWKKTSFVFVASAATFYFYLSPGGAGTWFELDDCDCREVSTPALLGVTATSASVVHPAWGTPTTAQRNVPRLENYGARVHPSATNVVLFSNPFHNGWTRTAVYPYQYSDVGFPQGSGLLETAVNSEHKVRRAALWTPVNLTTYTLSFCAKAIGARQIKISIELASGTIAQTFVLSQTEYTFCSWTFVTGAADAVATAIAVLLSNAGATTYLGSVVCGFYGCQYLQIEAASVATPSVYTYAVAASSVAPLYNVLGIDRWTAYWLSSPLFDFETKIVFLEWPVGAGAGPPVWSIDWGAGLAYADLTYVQGVGFLLNTQLIPCLWAPVIGEKYRIRVVVDPTGAGEIWVVNETRDVMDFNVAFLMRVWDAPDRNATALYLGADAAGAGQWNHCVDEAGG